MMAGKVTRASSSMSNYSDVDEKDILNEISDEPTDDSSRNSTRKNRHSYGREARGNLVRGYGGKYLDGDDDDLEMTGSQFLKTESKDWKKNEVAGTRNAFVPQVTSSTVPPIDASFSTNNSYSSSHQVEASGAKRDSSIIHVPMGGKSMDLEDVDEGGGGEGVRSSYVGIGQDTLEEIEDKARFYQDLESKGNLDYGHLNKQLQVQETMKSFLLDESGTHDTSYSPSKNNRTSDRSQQQDEGVSNGARRSVGKEIDVSNLLGKVELESTESLLPKKSIGFSDSNKIDHLAPPTFVDGGPKSAANTGQVSALTGTSTQLEALQKIMQQVRNSDDSLTGASSDMGAGGGDDMPDTGPLPWTATGTQRGLPTMTTTTAAAEASMDHEGGSRFSSDYSEKNAMKFGQTSEFRGFDLQPATGSIPIASVGNESYVAGNVSLSSRSDKNLMGSESNMSFDRFTGPPQTTGGPLILKSILKNSNSVQPKSGISPETKSKASSGRLKETAKKSHKESKRKSSKSPVDKSKNTKALPMQNSQPYSDHRQPATIRHSSPKQKTTLKHNSSATRGRAAKKGTLNRDKSLEGNHTMGAEFAPIDNDPFGRYSTEYDSQDLSPIRPTRTMHGGITVSPYSSRSPSGRKPNEAELVLVDQMKSEFRIKEINWQRKEDQLLNEYQSRVEDLNHENFALKAQLQSALDDLGKMKSGSDSKNQSSSPSFKSRTNALSSTNQIKGAKGPNELGGDSHRVQLPTTVTEAQWAEMNQQLSEQENLISGYQKENERLYEEIKQLKSVDAAGAGGMADKTATAAMFKENQKLLKEIGDLRDLLEERDSEIRVLQQMLSSSPKAEPPPSKHEELISSHEHIQHLRRSFSPSNQRSASPSKANRSPSPSNSNARPSKNKNVASPVSAYINNRTVEKMRLELLEKKDYIDKLQDSIRELQQEIVTEKCNSSAQKDKDAASIKELQWQLNQLEKKWVMSNNRDSVSALIKGTSSKTAAHIIDERVLRLQNEMAARDERAREAMKTLEQKFGGIKVQYEFRVKQLESELTVARNELAEAVISDRTAAQTHSPNTMGGEHHVRHVSPKGRRSQEAFIQQLEKDLNVERVKSAEKISSLEKQVADLNKQLSKANDDHKSRKPNTATGTTSNAPPTSVPNSAQFEKKRLYNIEQRLRAALSEIDLKNKEISGLRSQMKRLQSSTHAIPIAWAADSTNKSQHKVDSRLTPRGSVQEKRNPPQRGTAGADGKTQVLKSSADPDSSGNIPEMPATIEKMPEVACKEYDPSQFSEARVASEVLQEENEQLKKKIEQMTETYEAELDSLRSEVRECEGLLKSEQRSRSEQVSQLLAAHETQIKQLVIQHADEYSNSKVAQLQTKVSTQEVLIKHLRQQMLAATAQESELTASLEREKHLETRCEQMNTLVTKLRECQTPGSKQYEKVLDKLDRLQQRYDSRERELKEIISSNSHVTATQEVASENERLKVALQQKSEETSKFKLELDTMMQLLHSLKAQNVSIPLTPGMKEQFDVKKIT